MKASFSEAGAYVINYTRFNGVPTDPHEVQKAMCAAFEAGRGFERETCGGGEELKSVADKLVIDHGAFIQIKTARFMKMDLLAWTIPLAGPEYVFIYLRENPKEFSSCFKSHEQAKEVAAQIDMIMMKFEEMK